MANVIPVVFCFDKRIILGASVAIKSLIDCACQDTIYDVRIFHSDIGLDDQKNISSLFENSKHTVAFHYINPKIFANVPKSKGSWTEIVYYRFLIPSILKEYKKAIYSDVDVLFKDDLTELYNCNIENYELGAVRAEKNSPNTIGHKYFQENKKEYVFWSGLMLLNCEKFRVENLLETLLENAKIKYKELKFFDLDLMNITCQNILPLDFKYCVLQSINYRDDFNTSREYKYLKDVYTNEELIKAKTNPAIIHYAGSPGKPWRMKKPYEDYKKYVDELSKELKKYTFRDIRKKLFSKV
ncbi:MAG: glycosyltransferase family 8 protein [bacterium]|nr:glycosyltransferase family 8 protein [bacterium]